MARTRCIVPTVIVWMACFSCWGGQPATSKQSQLKQLQRQITKIDADVTALQRKKQQSTDQLKESEMRYGQVALSVKQLRGDIERLGDALSEIGEKMTQARRAIVTHKRELEGQVRSAYAMGGRERLKVLFNQQDPALSSRMLVYYDYLNRERLQKIRTVEAAFRTLGQLEEEKQKESAGLTATLQQRQREQNELQKVRQRREQLIGELDRLYSTKKSQLERLKSDERKLRQLIAALQKAADDFPFQEGPNKPFEQLKGALPWPLRGTLVEKFGAQRADSLWDGVLINAEEGSDIHAVTRGRVVYADWLRGYGLLTIIDHGKGYMTLYAFNQSLYKAEGDWVDAGEVIASVGKSGGRSQAALYFGIRKNGRPVDPSKWCRKIQRGRVG